MIEVPDEMAIPVLLADDAPGWDDANYVASRRVGDTWLDAGRSALLRVPALTGYPFESHVLINPRHPDVSQLHQSGPFPVVWDDRLLR